MNRMKKCFSFLTAMVAQFAFLIVMACADAPAQNDSFDMSLVFTPEIQLVVYVDGAWSDALSGSYGFADNVRLDAPTVEGKTFSHWEADGSIVSYSNPLKLTMNAHTTLFAVYADTAPTAQPAAGFTSIMRTNDGTAISFQAIADGAVTGTGIVYSTTATGNELEIGGSGVENAAAEKITGTTTAMPQSVLDDNNCWMLQITPDSADTVYHARAYVTVGGETTYGDVKDVKLSDLESGISLIANLEGFQPDTNDELSELTEGIKTVTFDANGGVGATIVQAYLGDTVTLRINTFTREGYRFLGWSTTSSGDVTYTDGQTVTLSENLSLYAVWDQEVSYTVTFKVVNGSWDDGTTADMTVTLDGYEGEPPKLTENQIPAVGTKPEDNYQAGSWDVTPDTGTVITEDTAYTYTYAAKAQTNVTVTFDANGHGTAPQAQVVTLGNKATEPEKPEADDYVFDGWYTDKDGTEAYAFDSAVTEDLTLYAKWVPSNATAEVVMEEPDRSEATDTDAEAPKKVDASGLTDFVAAELTEDITSVDIKLEVQPLTEAALAKTEEGKAQLDAIKAEAGLNDSSEEKVMLLDLSVTKTTVDSGGNTETTSVHELANGNKEFVLEIVIDYQTSGRGNFRMFRYHSDDGIVANGTAEGLRKLNTRPTDRQNYTDGTFYVGQGVIYVYTSRFSAYAMTFLEDRYSVEFDANGGQVSPESAVTNSEGKLTELPTPTRSGYTFNGWFDAETGGNKVSTDKVYTADTTIYAQWTQNASSGGSSTPSGGGYSGGGGVITYKVDIADTVNGTVKADKTQTSAGTTVTLTVTPDEGYKLDYVTARENNGNLVTLTDNGDGTWSFTMPSGKVTVNAVFIEEDAEPTPIATTEPVDTEPGYATCDHGDTCPLSAFTDLDPELWYHDGIHFALETGIMNGMGNGLFQPDTPTSRAMIVTMLWRMEGEPEVDDMNAALTFTDVAEDLWYTNAIRWAAAEGIVKGYNETIFGTDDPVTREQLVTILYRYAQYKGLEISIDTNILDYDDALTISDWAVEAFQWAVQEGIINGMGNGTLSPETDANRAQVATMLMRYDGVSDGASETTDSEVDGEAVDSEADTEAAAA